MKKLLLSLFVLSSSPLAFSQGSWTPRTSFPDSGYSQGISGFSIGNYGYAGLGSYTGAAISFDDFWQFNASTDSWTRKAPFPGRARVSPASFVIGGKAYVVTGSVTNGGACVNECWEYDTATDAWTQKAPFPGSARVYAVGFAIDSLGYVGTGAYELHDFRKDFYAYHPSTNTWTRVTDFGGIARDADCGFAVNGKGYVCFGQDSILNTYNDIWEYDPILNTWTQKSNNPGSRLVCAVGFSICNNIYVGSGDTTSYLHSDDYGKFWKYNTISGIWTEEANTPYPHRILGTAFAIGDTGYYGLGNDSTGLVHTIFDKFYAGDSCSNITTGDKDIADVSGLTIYPNPNNGIFTVVCHSSPPAGREESHATIEIYNIVGTKVFTKTLRSAHGDNLIRLTQPNGVYLYHIITEDGSLLKQGKVVIDK
ncbi:MAG TPA: kelch repeat-containing protein [Bacteroidia bacterium]|jgi:hypothetical protein|nr:kelch repeat-containing protein [Bacteroidia bacterium]